jgi:hypothetical protein
VAIALVNHVLGQLSANTPTSAIDTTGANLLVISTANVGTAAETISDSKSNTWVALTQQSFASLQTCRIWYAINPTVGTGHTFQSNFVAFGSGGMSVTAWSGADTSSPFDVQNGSSALNGTTGQCGSVTPGVANEVVISAVTLDDPGTISIDSGFTITDQAPLVGGLSYGLAQAYLIQTTATAANPTWTFNSTVGSGCVATFKAAAGAAALNFGWYRRLDESRLRRVERLPDQATSFFRPSQVPVPTNTFLPRTGENRERNMPPVRRPDEPFPWFVRSPAPVPAQWLPLTGEDIEHRFPVKRSPDEPFTFFVRSSNPVPTIVLPRTGEDVERLPPIKRPPDEPGTWFRPSQVPVPTFLWFGGWDQPWVRPRSDQYVVTWPSAPPIGQVNTIAGMAWHISKEEMRPPRPPLNPDEFRQWFVRSPAPVPQTWLPQPYDQSPFRLKVDQYITSWSPQVFAAASTIAGIAWWRPADDARTVAGRGIRSPDEAIPWFVRSPNPVPQTWLPTAGETEHPVPVKRSPDEPPGQWFVRSPVPVPFTWLPTTGEDIEHIVPIKRSPDEAIPWFRPSQNPVPVTWLTQPYDQPPFPPKADQYRTSWNPQTFVAASTIAGMAWWRQADLEKRSSIGAISDRYAITWQARTPPPFVGISGMAWFIPPEQIPRSYPGNTNQLWATTWAPQIVAPSPITINASEWIIRARRRGRR